MKALPFLRDFFWAGLLPVSLLWATLHWLRRRYYPASRRYRASVPVLCVGNLHSGGSGKTPLVAAVAKKFAHLNPIVVSRGYRGTLSRTGALVERDRTDGAVLYGDEPWMLANLLSSDVFVDRDRARAIRAVEGRSRPVILDDGFQHVRVLPSCSLVLINAERSPDDAHCLPLGDLREPLSALKKASAVVLVDGRRLADWRGVLAEGFPSLPVFEISRRPGIIWNADAPIALPSGTPVGAFCGIARADGFFSDLAKVADVRWSEAFPDHHAYTEGQIDSLISRPGPFVTTDKDWFKLRSRFEARGIALLRFRIEYEISPEFWYFLENHWAR